MTKCAAVVWRLVPYHDARFSAAAGRMDISVVEVSGRDGGAAWSETFERSFRMVALGGENGADGANLPIAKLVRTLDELRPDVVAVQGWADQAAFATADWAVCNGAGIVVISESNIYDHARAGWSEALKASVLRLCDAALVGGQDHADYLIQLGFPRERIAFGYNVVDNTHFARTAAQTSPAGTPYFLVVSRLVENKNVELVIRSFAGYRRAAASIPWDLVILGAGPLEGHLRQVASELGLDGCVRFEGFRRYHELPSLYHGAGALVMASTWEPWGLAVNEAMAAGLLVIVSGRVGCVSELVRDGRNGFVFAPDDAAALTRHMLALAEGAVDRAAMGLESERIIADWGPERFADGLARAVELAGRPRAPHRWHDRMLIKALAHYRGWLSSGALLAARSEKQNRLA